MTNLGEAKDDACSISGEQKSCAGIGWGMLRDPLAFVTLPLLFFLYWIEVKAGVKTSMCRMGKDVGEGHNNRSWHYSWTRNR